MTDDDQSQSLARAILEQLPGARRVYFDHGYVLVEDDQDKITRYRLSPEAERIALLEREGRPLDIPLGDVDLLVPPA